MTFTQIDYFIIVAEELSVSRAAELCCISQSAMSRQIALLEEELEVKLIQRLYHSIALTDAGKTIYECFTRMRMELNTAIAKAAEQDQVFSEKLRLGALDAWDIDVLYADFFAAFRAEHPGLDLQCMVYNLGDMQNALEKGQLDMILTVKESLIAKKYLHTATVTPFHACLLYSRSHRLASLPEATLPDCDGETLLISTERNLQEYFKGLLEDIAKEGGKLKYFQVPNYPSILREARRGQYLMLADSFDQHSSDEFCKVPLNISFQLCLAWIKSSRIQQKFVQAFSEYHKSIQTG